MRYQKESRWLTFWLLCLPFIFLTGCIETRYELEMSADGEKLKRKISVKSNFVERNAKFSASEDEVQLLATAYGKDFPKKEMKPTVFENEFVGKTPTGIGGAGFFVNWDSNFGATTAYIERFRGSDDFAEQLRLRRESVDVLVDHVVAWLKAETKGEVLHDDVVSLLNFAETQFRKDLHNVSIYLWHARTADTGESLSRLGLYLLERGWIKPEQLPEFFNFKSNSEGSQKKNFELAMKLICQPRDLDPVVIRKAIPALNNATALEKSFAAFMESTNDFKAFKKRMEQQTEQAATGSGYLGELMTKAFLWSPLFSRVSVDITFDSPVEPLFTNGEWDNGSKRLTWSHGILGRGEGKFSPTDLSFAYWAKPDQAAQQKQFGQVIFKGFELIRYCAWYDQLGEANQQKWKEVLATIEPGEQFWRRMRQAERAVDSLAKEDDSGATLKAGLEMLRHRLKNP